MLCCLIAKSFCDLSHFDSFATPWTVACQAPLSMGFPKQEYWSGLPFLYLLHWQRGSFSLSHQGSDVCLCIGSLVYVELASDG